MLIIYVLWTVYHPVVIYYVQRETGKELEVLNRLSLITVDCKLLINSIQHLTNFPEYK